MAIATGETSVIDAKVRKMVWRSMRIMRRFTLSGILMTIPGEGNSRQAQRYFQGLLQNGYLSQLGTNENVGLEFTGYSLLRDAGPEPPIFAMNQESASSSFLNVPAAGMRPT